jgi:polysaccharide biosynthesis transport protein
MAPRSRESALELAWALWRRRKWYGVVVFAAAFCGLASLVMGLPDLYRASATILVDQAQVSESFARSSVTGDVEPRLQSLSQEILSRARLQELVSRFNLYPELRRRGAAEALVERMRKDIRFERKEVGQQWGRGVTIGFTVSYQGWDPHAVAQVTNALASFYVAENHRMRERQAVGTTALLKEQLEEIRKRIDAGAREAKRAEAAAREAERAERAERARARPRGPERLADPAVERLAKLKRELAELRTQYSEKYPDVLRTKDEIATLERHLEEHPPVAQVAPAERADDRDEPYDRFRERRDPTPDSLSVREFYASLLKRYEEAQLAETLERQKGEQFQILDSAVVPSGPVAPNRLQLLVMAMILSGALAGVAMALAEALDTSFHRTEQLRAFIQLPILASIPRIVTSADTWRDRLRIAALTVMIVAGLALIIRGSYQLGQGGEQVVWMFAQRGA